MHLDFTSLNHILVPRHVNDNHYVLVDVDMKGRKFAMYESQQKGLWDRIKVLKNEQIMIQDAIDDRNIATFFLKHRVNKWEAVHQPIDIPQQSDFSCGVFVCGLPPVSQTFLV